MMDVDSAVRIKQGASLGTIHVRSQAVSLALVSTFGLTALKLSTAYVSHSVGVLSEGIHSLLDMMSALLSYFTVRVAGRPADIGHPFGHGKIETLSSLFESFLLLGAGLLIIYEGVEHLKTNQTVEFEGLAIGVIVFSLVVSFFVYRHNLRAANRVDSSAIRVNALHFFSDVISSIGILIGLVLLKLTGWQPIDPIIGFVVAAYIIWISAKQIHSAVNELTDTRLPDREVEAIRNILSEFQNRKEALEIARLRTRKSGATRHITFHLIVCGKMQVEEAHQVCDRIEDRLSQRFQDSLINIHVEPCDKTKHLCDKRICNQNTLN